MEKVLFVCTANICRSPMAAGIFNALAGDRGLDSWAESSGVAALAGEPAAPYSRQVMGELGINIEEHRARQVDETMLREADLVLAMTPRHRDTLHRNFGAHREKVYTLHEYSVGDGSGGIADPYGHSLGTYRSSAREILSYVEILVKRLERERAS